MPFQLQLLGAFKLVSGEQTINSVRSRRVLGLLAYLVCETRPVPRTELAHLLWPDKTEKQGRTNLRWAIGELRKLMPDALVTTRQTVEFVCPAGSQVDLHLIREPTFQVSETWEVFLLNLHPTLLDGFYFNESVEYETWLLTQREIWRQHVHRALDTAIENANDPATALQLAQHQLSLDTWEESYHRRVIRLLAQQGDYESALAQFETCQRILQDEFGTEPTRETLALVERIEQLGHAPRHNLPTQPTPFIGRGETVHDIAQQLAGQARLVTLVGAGGMGKTRLALAVATDCTHHFLDGVAFIPFVGVNEPSYMAMALVQALAEAQMIPPLQGHQPPAGYLTQHLHDKELLLILDNLEHLLDGVTLLSDLLQAVPKLTILATSRERLNLRWEQLVELTGLPYPTDPADPNWLDYAAVQLFVQSAQRARPGFTVTNDNRPGITQLCQLTDGMPLGLELSATWVRMQTPSAISQAISQNLDLLTSRQRDTPSRHRSIRATLDYSWALLDPAEQATLAQLSVFRGEFSAESAGAVAKADWGQLATLVDKSLLRQRMVSSPAGQSHIRYNLHEFIRQYASEQLGQQTKATQTRHAQHYADLLGQLRPRLHGHQQHTSLDTIAHNLDNIRQAWHWAIANHALEPLNQLLYSLCFFYVERSWYAQGMADLDEAITKLEAYTPRPTLALARLALQQSRFRFYLGQHDLAVAQLRQNLPIFEDHNALWEQGMCWLGIGVLADKDEQIAHYTRAIRLFEVAGEDWYAARTQLNLSVTLANNVGSRTEAIHLIEASVETFRRLGDEIELARALMFLVNDHRMTGNYALTQQLLEECLTRHQNLGDQWGEALTWLGLNGAWRSQGAFDQAEQCVRQAQKIYDALGYQTGQLSAMQAEVALAFDSGEWAKAEQLAQRLLQLNDEWSVVDQFPAGEAHHILGKIASGRGDYATADTHFQTAHTLLADIPERLGFLYISQAWHCLAQNQLDETQAYLVKAQTIAQRIVCVPLTLAGQALEGALLLQQGQIEVGLQLLEEVVENPAGDYRTKAHAKQLLTKTHA